MRLEDEIKQVNFKNAHHKAVINLIFTANWLTNKNHDFFKKFDVTNTQFNILRILRGNQPNKMSGAEIKSRMLDKNSDVSRLLNRLITKRFIEKNLCPKDKRAFDVVITKKGLDLLNKIDEDMDTIESKVLKINASEAKQLSELLDKCRD